MLTAAKQHALDQFVKSLQALGDDALLDAYHQAAEDCRAAQAEGSDDLAKAHAQMLAAKTAVRARFADHVARYEARYPLSQFRDQACGNRT
jgi:hypothetical protein